MSLFRCRTPSSLIYSILLYYVILHYIVFSSILCMCVDVCQLPTSQTTLDPNSKGTEWIVAVHYNASNVPFTSSILSLQDHRVPAWSIQEFWSDLCHSLQSPQHSRITGLTPQLEVMCQSSAITRDQNKAFLSMTGKSKRREGVRGRTKEGVISLYCYASVVIIVKRLKMRCTQPSCIPGESW